MSNIHDHLKSEIIKHKHKFPATMYRGVSITEFNAEELRALICILGDMGVKGVDREVMSDITNRPETGRQYD